MKITESKFFSTADAAINGGRFSQILRRDNFLQIVSAIVAPYKDLLSKAFAFNDAAQTAERVAIALDYPSGSNLTAVFLAEGTQRDTESTFSPARHYAIGTLTAGVLTGATAINVQFPTGAGALNAVQAGDKLILRKPVVNNAHTGVDPLFYDVVTVNTVNFTGDLAAITLTTGLANDWDINSTCASVVAKAEIKATLDNVVKTNCTATESNIVLTNAATVEETFTLTFSSLTAFTCSGDSLGGLGSGNTSTTFAPLNPTTGTPYFTITPTVWGTISANAVLSFQTHPSATPLWLIARNYAGESVKTLAKALNLFTANY